MDIGKSLGRENATAVYAALCGWDYEKPANDPAVERRGISQQIEEIKKELANPELARQRFEASYKPSIGRLELFKYRFYPSSDFLFINPRQKEMVRREAAETSPTLVDYCEKADHGERKELFKEIVRENWDLNHFRHYLGQWYSEFAQTCGELALEE